MFIYEIVILVLAIGLDVGSKYLMASVLGVVDYGGYRLADRSVTAIPKLLEFVYHENTGAGFGIFQGRVVLLAVFTSVALVGVIVYLCFNKKESKLLRLALILVVGGGFGNLYDRIFIGYVRDFMNFLFIDFPVFNVADSFVTVGAGLLIIYAIKLFVDESRAVKAKKTAATDTIAENTAEGGENG